MDDPEHSDDKPKYRLAVAILLKSDFPDQVGDVELYDPEFLPTDCKAPEMLGLRVLPANEHFQRPANKPTLFFPLSANRWHVGNVLEVNWCATMSNQMIIFSNSLDVENQDQKLAERFFDIDPKVDLESLLPGICESLDSIIRLEFFREQFDDFDPLHGYHFPRRHRCKWQLPPAGWLKLNFSSKARDRVSPADYGGILRNEYGNMIATYSCSLSELADATVANAEALRVGMRLLEDVPGGVKQLVMEGTDLSVARWANSWPEPPEKVKEAVDDILKVVARIKTVIYHVYEKANEAAIASAKEGATSEDRRVWISSEIRGKWAKNLAKLTIKGSG
ncbi:hypothetical protein NL676_019066 [Syzygium grande]|nr:hypothetical protein NL676_019066 [Syzygium grande]